MVAMTSRGISQTLDSVTCIPNSQLRIAINLIEKGKITQQELDSTQELVKYLDKRIATKDSLLLRYGQKDLYWKKIDSVNKAKIVNLNSIIDNDKTIYSIQDKTIRRQKKLGLAKLGFGVLVGLLISK